MPNSLPLSVTLYVQIGLMNCMTQAQNQYRLCIDGRYRNPAEHEPFQSGIVHLGLGLFLDPMQHPMAVAETLDTLNLYGQTDHA
jgi:hypothetical protein